MSLQEKPDQAGGHIIRVCSAQLASTWERPDQTLLRAETFIRHAADCGAKLICFPEQFATGWNPCPHKNIQDIRGNIVSTLQGYAKEYRIGILGSLREAHDPLPKNTAIVIGRDGRILASYAKMHLFSFSREHEGNSPGTELGIFTFDSLTCGIAICYDLRFPELFRIYAKRRPCSFCPGCLAPKSQQALGALLITARAAENQMYILGVNTTGKTPIDTYAGASMTADPQGMIISRAGEAEQLLFSDVDPGEVERIRRSFPVERDRRDALYHSLRTRKY